MNLDQSIFIRPCDTCRIRKIKCDRGLPTCLRCLKSIIKCSYDFIPTKRGPKGDRGIQSKNRGCGKNDLKSESPPKSKHSPRRGDVTLLSTLTMVKKTQKDILKHVILNANEPSPSPIKSNQKEKGMNDVTESSLDKNLIQMLMSNLTIGDSQKLYLSMSGKMSYFGDSPMGFLLTMYTVNHSNKGSLLSVISNMKFPEKTLSLDPSDQSLGSFHIFELNIIVKKCIQLYFEFFHPYCPVVNKKKFLNDPSQQSPLLLNLVCAIGTSYCPKTSSKYLKFFSKQVAHYFKGVYYKCNLETVKALILMGHFQHDPEEFKKGWVYLGYAQHMIVALGIDKEPPKCLDPEEAEIRRRLWHWSFILDQFYSFSLNRPSGQDCKFNSPDYPTNFTFELRTKDKKESILTQCSIISISLLSKLCYIVCIIFKKFNFIEEIKEDIVNDLEKVTKTLSKSLELWNKEADQSFIKFLLNCTSSEFSIVSNFALGLKLIYYGTLTQLFQPLSKVSDENISNYYDSKCSEASRQAIDSAWKLGFNFNFHLTTYKFYVLSCAIMFQIKKVKSPNPYVSSKAKLFLKKGLIVLIRAQSNYKFSSEFLSSFSLLIRVERIELDDIDF